jgi:hypothetical protein
MFIHVLLYFLDYKTTHLYVDSVITMSTDPLAQDQKKVVRTSELKKLF